MRSLQDTEDSTEYAEYSSIHYTAYSIYWYILEWWLTMDLGRIQEKSEIVAYLSRVDTISYAESLLLGDPFDFLSSWPR